jgi:hypothetical protein
MRIPRRALPPVAVLLLLVGCGDTTGPDAGPGPDPGDGIARIPVVVHVLHHGEPLGDGYNLPADRIHRQIEILNEDFRRKPGTPGFNTHPDGADALIEFVLARQTPAGDPTDGIHRVDVSAIVNPVPPGERFDHNAFYGYWDPTLYLNVWIEPLPESTIDIVLGSATGPDTDLPGADLFAPGEPTQSEGVLINSFHFGESSASSVHHLGRTLTHEVGHYLGVLHPWGSGDCATNDYCDDTRPVSGAHGGCPDPPPPACDGSPVMVANYMDYGDDDCMNVFTNDQVARMHHVLENSPTRASLLTSPGLEPPDAGGR